MEWAQVFSYAILFATILLGLIGIISVFIIHDINKWSKKFCFIFFSVLILEKISELTGDIAFNIQNNIALTIWANCTEMFFLSAITPLLTLYLLHYCGENPKKSFLMNLNLGIWLILAVVLAVTTLAGDFLILPTQTGHYRIGKFLPLVSFLGIYGNIINLTALLRRRKKLKKSRFVMFLLYLIVPIYALMMIMEFVLLLDQAQRYAEQKEEIAKQKASIDVLKMRPHFIYNTMTSIYYLIEQDPQKAQQVTLNFTTYLRKNFTAIAKEGTIPFAEELEHTKAYLSVEQVRFEGMLFVEFNISYTSFRLPPLTMQPIVENAVKHGVDPDAEPLHITIHTREVKSGVEITVEDTGPGFAQKDNSEPHIALANIRERLEMVCNGKLTIHVGKSGGTTVRIFIPQE